MKITRLIKFLLLLFGVGNLNFSFAQTDLLDLTSSLAKLRPSAPVHYQNQADLGDRLISIQWMTEDFSTQLKDAVAVSCQPLGIQVTTKNIVAGSTIPLTLYDPENDKGDEYKLRGTVAADGIARVVFNMCEPDAFHDFKPTTHQFKIAEKEPAQSGSKQPLESKKNKESEKKITSQKQQGESDTIVDVKWMTADFTQDIHDTFPCEPVGILVQTQNIEVGQEIEVVIESKNHNHIDDQATEYTVYGRVEPDQRVRIVFNQHIDRNHCKDNELAPQSELPIVDDQQAVPEIMPAKKLDI
jgi:hypothetical protein